MKILSYLLLFLLFLNLALAQQYNQSIPSTMVSTNPWNRQTGYNMTNNYAGDIYINAVDMPTNSNANNVSIYFNGTLTRQATAYFGGGLQAIFSSPVLITRGSNFIIAIDAGGNTYNDKYGTGSYPLTQTYLVWKETAYCNNVYASCTGWSVEAVNWHAISNINISLPAAAPNLDSIRAVIDKNTTTTSEIWVNWTTIGNYSYSELFSGTTLCYNGTDKYGTCTGLTNGTQYLINVSVYWNSTLHNHTTTYITTNQTAQLAGPPSLDSVRAYFDKNITSNISIWLNWSVIGNYSYSELFSATTLCYNGSNTYGNCTGLTNGTQYLINVSVYWNNTLHNHTTAYINTDQTDQLVSTGSTAGEYDDELDIIVEAVQMLPLILLYIGLLTIGYIMLTHGNFVVGTPFILITIFFDIYFFNFYSTEQLLRWAFIFLILVKGVGWAYLRRVK